MTNPFNRRGNATSGSVLERPTTCQHRVESDFSHTKCRFVLTCTCGASHETRYIDEALEWSTMHKELAPLADQLANPRSCHG